MKRIISIAMAMLLLVGMAQVVRAEPEPLRVLAGSDQSAEAYGKAYPDRAIRLIPVDYQLGYRGNLAQLIQQGDWDAAIIGTQEFCLSELAGAGLAMDIGAF